MVAYNKDDLTFILQQIKISEAHAAGTPLTDLVTNPLLPFGLRTVDGTFNNIIPGRETWGSADQPFPRLTDPSYRTGTGDPAFDINGPAPGGTGVGSDYAHLAGQPLDVVDTAPRTISNLIVDQTINNPAAVIAALERAGSADPHGDAELLMAAHMTDAEAAAFLTAATTARTVASTNLQTALNDFLANPTAANSAALNTASAAFTTAHETYLDAVAADADHVQYLVDKAASFGVEIDGNTLVIPNLAPDEGISASFNSWMTLFGQFFDHGLDLVEKTASTKVYIPLAADDPLRTVGPDGIAGTGDEVPASRAFMVVTRTEADARNVTTPLVDQNQTYTSHASHQVFLREYVRVDQDGNAATNDVFTTGHLLEGSNDGLATWADVKAQSADMLGLRLSDEHIGRVPLLATDEYGRFERGPNGFAQIVVTVTDSAGNSRDVLVEGTATDAGDGLAGLDIRAIALGDVSAAELATLLLPASAANGNTPPLNGNTATYTFAVEFTGHAFLDDIAHTANPYLSDGSNRTGDADGAPGDHFSQFVDAAGNPAAGPGPGITNLGNNQVGSGSTFYDNELLDRHFITGDGRGNENIGLTTVHHVFHSEHNRLAEHTKDVTVATGDLAFVNEWLLSPITQPVLDAINAIIDPVAKNAAIDALEWNGERLFQAARFGTEMQYQHLVFEEFARKVNPAIDLFVFNPTMDINPAIFAEFAHTVYRFGHSMLTETVDRLAVDGQTSDDIGLIEAFLNPIEFDQDAAVSADVAAGAIVRGMTRQMGNEIDEFVTEALRNNLLGLPLDLAAINLARGREAGIPTLQEARAQFYAEARSEWVKPYTSWTDFAEHLKNPASVINFIAAYGTHSALTAADVDTLAERRAVATALVLGGSAVINEGTVDERTFTATEDDRLDFLNATDAYAGGSLGGLNNVDFWIGGLAEAILPFGGMLGSSFTFVFEKQLENLQNGDRFYYLSRTQGTHFLQELENNAFSKMIMRNTDLGVLADIDGAGPGTEMGRTHLPGEIFSTPQYILEMHEALQTDYNGADPGRDPAHDDPTLEGLAPKVARDINLTIDGVTYDRSLKFTGGEHVVLGGSEDNDVLIGDLGDDTIWGDGGNDYIEGGHGINRLHGGAGNDIIYGGGDPEFIHGDEGDDVINGGNGLGDLIFGGSGSDFVVGGIDGREVFGAEGNDFILGSPDVDFLLGGEGDDWIEGAEGFDTIAGENSQLFFNSSIIGHDVMFSGTNEMDFDAESGDDIMVQGESVMRNEGMFGFDWVSFEEHLHFGADADMNIKIFTTVEADILRNRFDRVEAVSGSKFDDVVVGDNRVTAGGALPLGVPGDGLTLESDGLDRAGVDRIAGLRDVLGLTQAQLNAFATSDIVFDDGNILLGGDASDTLTGGGGNDIIDGDKWLNVRIAINDASGNQIGTAEKMQGPVTFFANAPAALQALNALPLDSPARALDTLMFDRTVTPAQLSIVREILDSSDDPLGTSVAGNAGDLDTAVFRGSFAEYTFSDEAGNILNPATLAGRGDGVIIVSHTSGEGGTGTIFDDGTDRIVNVERLQFSDQSIALVGGLNAAPVGAAVVQTLVDADGNPIVQAGLPVRLATNPDGSLAGVTDADNNGAPITSFTVTWQIETAPGSGSFLDAGASGLVFTPSADPVLALDGERVRALVTFVDGHGVRETVATAPTLPLAAPTNLVGTPGIDILVGRHAIPNIAANQGFGIALPQSGNDGTLAAPIDAGLGDDDIFGLSGDDVLSGGAAGEGNEILDGGAGTDIAVFYGSPIDYTFGLNAEGDLEVIHVATGEEDAVINIETLRFDDNGTITEFSVAGILNGVFIFDDGGDNLLTGTEFGDIIFGNGGADTIDALGGIDMIAGGEGDDAIDSGGGDDIVSGGSGDNDIRLRAGNETVLVGLGETGTDTVRDVGGTETLSIGAELVANVTNETAQVVTASGQVTSIGAADDGAGNLSVAVNGKTVIISDHFNDPDSVLELVNFNNSAFGRTTLSAGASSLIAAAAGVTALTGTAGRDALFGTGSVNALTGGDGDDVYFVDAATDSVTEGSGANSGIDTIVSAVSRVLSANVENLALIGTAAANGTGTADANVMTGNDGANILLGLGGTDTLEGGLGTDTLNGGADSDTYVYRPGDGNDTIVELSGTADRILIDADGAALTSLSAGDNNLGTNNGDLVITINGQTLTVIDHFDQTSENVELINFDGATFAGYALGTGDYAIGSTDPATNVRAAAVGVNTLLAGETGANTLNGNSGNDLLFGFGGNDTLSGGAGGDLLVGGLGTDNINGGDGDDTIVHTVGDGAGSVNGGNNTDRLVILANGGNQNLNVTFNGTAITLFDGSALSNTEIVLLDLGGGTDTLTYTAPGGATVNLATGAASGFATIANVENVTGNGGADNFTGDGNDNVLTGNGGADVLAGGGGADTLSGGAGDNDLAGDAGDDTLVASTGAGNRSDMDGGADIDTANYSAFTTALNVTLNGATIATVGGTANGTGLGANAADTIVNVENFTGGSAADTIIGDANANVLTGNGGIDNLQGGGGGDILIGGIGADSLDAGTGDNASDTIRFNATNEYGDTVTSFDSVGPNIDIVQLGGALNTAFDDVVANDTIEFASGNGAAGTVTVTINAAAANAVEALYLSGAAGEGVTNAQLNSAAAVAAAFNAEFAITAANGQDALLVVNDTAGNDFSVWQWIQAGGGEIAAGELQLIGVFRSNATVTAASFDFI